MPAITSFGVSRRAGLDELRAHHEVVVEERARVVAVGADPAHARGEVDDEVRHRRVEHALDGVHAGQVEVPAARHEGRAQPRRVQPLDHVAAEEAVAAGDDDAALRPRSLHTDLRERPILPVAGRGSALEGDPGARTPAPSFRTAGMSMSTTAPEPPVPAASPAAASRAWPGSRSSSRLTRRRGTSPSSSSASGRSSSRSPTTTRSSSPSTRRPTAPRPSSTRPGPRTCASSS